MPEGVALAGSFAATPAELAEWRRRLAAVLGGIVSSTDATPDVASVGSSVTICYFDGDFGRPRGGPPDSVPNCSRIVVVVDEEGLPTVAAQGFVDELPIIDPNS